MMPEWLDKERKRRADRKKLENTPVRDITYRDIDEMIHICDEDKFLLKEVLRFILKQGRLPTAKDFKASNGYPNSAQFYKYYNGTYSRNKGITGAISFLNDWNFSRKLRLPKHEFKEKIRYRDKYHFFSKIERNLINKLKCENTGNYKHKFRNVSCEDYGNIIIKFSSLNNNMWIFNLRKNIEDNQDIDNFICVATDYELTEVKYIWFIMNAEFYNIKNLTVYNTKGSLKRLESYDITKPFNSKQLIN